MVKVFNSGNFPFNYAVKKHEVFALYLATFTMEDKIVNEIVNVLKKSESGMTITDLVKQTSFSRSSVRTSLARLEGAKTVEYRNIGMAKLYILRSHK